MTAGLVMLAVVASAPGPEVRGDTTCPSAAEVTEHLAPMLAPEAALPSGGFVELVDVPARVPGLLDVEVRLRSAGEDAPSAVRRVERNGGCSETADAVAVIAASWAGRYATPQASALTEAPSPAPTPAPTPVPTPARGPSPPVDAAGDAAPPRSSSTGVSVGLAVGAVAATSGGSAVLGGGEIEARRGRWTVRLQVAGSGERTVASPTLAAGSFAAWRRLLALPSVGFIWGSPRAFLQPGVGLALGLTETRGQGFASNNSGAGLDIGAAPGLRLGARLAAVPVTVWAGAVGMFWLRPHRVSADGSSATQDLPRWDAWLGGGLTFSFDS